MTDSLNNTAPRTGFCLFDTNWWLDAVAPGRWEYLDINDNGRLAARWPLVWGKSRLLRTIGMPPFTKTLGPWVDTGEGRPARQLGNQHAALTELIGKLPRHDRLRQNFHGDMDNWLPFYWQGFGQTTHYSYVLDNLTDTDAVFSGFSESTRRAVRKAEKAVTIQDLDLDAFLAVNAKSFKRQDMEAPDPGIIRRLEDACAPRGARRIIGAVDEQGRVHAGAYIVHDERCAYYLLGGMDESLRDSQAMSLVMWEAIRHAGRVSRKFDFEGSMIEPIERFFRGFGATQSPYFKISKANGRARLLGTLSGR